MTTWSLSSSDTRSLLNCTNSVFVSLSLTWRRLSSNGGGGGNGGAHYFYKLTFNYVMNIRVKFVYLCSLLTNTRYTETFTHIPTYVHRGRHKESTSPSTPARHNDLSFTQTPWTVPSGTGGSRIHHHHMSIYTHKELKPHPQDSSLLYVLLYKSGSLVNVRNSLRGLAKRRPGKQERRVCNRTAPLQVQDLGTTNNEESLARENKTDRLWWERLL